jgi:hypothetical protein
LNLNWGRYIIVMGFEQITRGAKEMRDGDGGGIKEWELIKANYFVECLAILSIWEGGK